MVCRQGPGRHSAASSASRAASSPDSTASQRSGRPAAASVTANSSCASVLPMPSNETAVAEPAGPACSHSPADTTLPPQPRAQEVVMAGRSLALSEYCSTHGAPNADSPPRSRNDGRSTT